MAKGSVRKKGKKWYYRFYVEDASGNLVQKECVGTESKSETEKLLRQAMDDYEKKKFVAKADNLTVGQLLDVWAEEELKTGTLSNGTVENLEEVGQMPLPPYIHEKLKDKERYQTVYSKELGSAAAPTAGLHFTKDMLKKLKEKGVNEAYVTLHVGLGTFRPVKEDDVLQHQMHSEHYHLPQETVDMIRETKANGGRVIAVGTTSCRTLEAVATAHNGELVAEDGYTDIFIYPGYSFKVLDGLITNFHLPESTLIMLISAFLGYEKTMHAYEIAVQEKYRFFSFGDAMCILPEKSE